MRELRRKIRNMNGLYLTPLQLMQQRRMYQRWKNDGFLSLDQPLQPVIERLNELPGVCTVSSCMGHHKSGGKIKLPFYLSFATTGEGAEVVRSIYSQLARRLVEVKNAYDADIGVIPNQPSYAQVMYEDFQLIETHKELDLADERVVYNRLMIVAKGTHLPVLRDNLIKEFLVVLNRMLMKEAA